MHEREKNERILWYLELYKPKQSIRRREDDVSNVKSTDKRHDTDTKTESYVVIVRS